MDVEGGGAAVALDGFSPPASSPDGADDSLGRVSVEPPVMTRGSDPVLRPLLRPHRHSSFSSARVRHPSSARSRSFVPTLRLMTSLIVAIAAADAAAAVSTVAPRRGVVVVASSAPRPPEPLVSTKSRTLSSRSRSRPRPPSSRSAAAMKPQLGLRGGGGGVMEDGIDGDDGDDGGPSAAGDVVMGSEDAGGAGAATAGAADDDVGATERRRVTLIDERGDEITSPPATVRRSPDDAVLSSSVSSDDGEAAKVAKADPDLAPAPTGRPESPQPPSTGEGMASVRGGEEVEEAGEAPPKPLREDVVGTNEDGSGASGREAPPLPPPPRKAPSATTTPSSSSSSGGTGAGAGDRRGGAVRSAFSSIRSTSRRGLWDASKSRVRAASDAARRAVGGLIMAPPPTDDDSDTAGAGAGRSVVGGGLAVALAGFVSRPPDVPLTNLGVFLCTLLGSSVGFHNYLYFISLGYASALGLSAATSLLAYNKLSNVPIPLPTNIHTTLVLLWAVRLGSFLLHREFVNWPRYHERVVRADAENEAAIVSRTSVWIACSAFYYALFSSCHGRLRQAAAVGTGAGAARTSSTSTWGVVGLAGIVLQVLGLTVETVADAQKASFKSRDGGVNRNRWCGEGLFRYVDHPNYVGEGTFWIGTYLGGVGVGGRGLGGRLVSLGGLVGILCVMRGAAESLGARQAERYRDQVDYMRSRSGESICLGLIRLPPAGARSTDEVVALLSSP